MRICKTCNLNKELSEFYKNGSRPGTRTECKVCYNLKAMIRHNEKPLSTERRRINGAKFRADNPTYYHGQYSVSKARNPGKLKETWARKKANRRNAMPKWLTAEQREQIKQIYITCPEGFHVDHIVPIAGKDVRGLHVPWNLQHLPAIDNLKKGNRL
jgi:hypothetical protein